jgi:dihydroorotate dehydrogenase electron transfer subunit
MGRDTYRLRLHCPDIAAQIVPGQFFMVRAPGDDDPLLGRPFALYDIYEDQGRPTGIDFGYLVIGKLTSAMSRWRPGDAAAVWGPLGNGFPVPGP